MTCILYLQYSEIYIQLEKSILYFTVLEKRKFENCISEKILLNIFSESNFVRKKSPRYQKGVLLFIK